MYVAPRGESLFFVLDDEIWEFPKDGDIMLLGDFNDRTKNCQTINLHSSDNHLSQFVRIKPVAVF